MNIVQLPRRFVRSHWGGTETVILETCKRLLKMGHHTEIFCSNALARQNRETIASVLVTRFPYFYPYLGLSTDARQLLDRKGGNLFSFSLMRALRRFPDLDLIHLHTAKRPGGIGRYVALKRGIPYVVSLHGGVFDVPDEEAGTWTAPTTNALEWGKVLGWWVGSRRVLDNAAAILCVGLEEQRQVLQRYPHKKVLHLPNGVDPDRFAVGDGKEFRRRHQISLNAYVILTVGRIDPQKNQLFAVEVLPDIVRMNLSAHMVMVGPVTNEPYMRKLSQRIDAAGLQGRVTVIDGLDAESQELADAYHAADVFLLPSIHEPFGIVILEAWAAGLPVIATRVGGIPSFVSDGRDGLLFDVNDAAGVCRAFGILLERPEKAHEFSIAGSLKARTRYSWDAVTQSLVKIYEEAVRENTLRQ
jgi:glycosyltransferase involved in cell wall biosynthesis